KFMQLSDECMRMYYELLTDVPLDQVQAILAGHPKEAKLTLGKSIITEYHNAAAAQAAADQWEREIGGGALPADIPVVEIRPSDMGADGTLPAANLLKLAGLCDSTSEARRAIQQGGAKLGEDKARIEAHDQPIT